MIYCLDVSSRFAVVRVLGKFSDVSQGSTLAYVLFNVFINDLYVKIHHFFLVFADDLKIYRIVKSLEDCR
jgi:hypothetical protein